MTYKDAALKLCGGYLDMPSGCDGCPLATGDYDDDGNMTCKLNMVSETPIADAVTVVHCRDCKYIESATWNKKGYRICPASHMEITDDDFCSYGEQKESPND